MLSSKRKSGFTLLELMVTIGLIGIAAAIAIPNFMIFLPNWRLKTDARDLYSTVQMARMRAIKERENVVMTFNPGNEGYTVFVDDGAGGGTAKDGIQNGAEPTIRTGNMSSGIDLYQASFPSGTWVRFNSRGLPNGLGGHVYLRNTQNNYMGITVNITGNPRIVKSSNGDSWS